MGWNDHVDWDILEDFEYLADNGHFDHLDDEEQKSKLYDACEAVAFGLATPRDRALVSLLFDPVRAGIEDMRREDYLEYLMSKDD